MDYQQSWKNKNKNNFKSKLKNIDSKNKKTSKLKLKKPSFKKPNINFKKLNFLKLIFNKKFLLFGFSVFILGLLSIVIMIIVISKDLPDPNQLIDRDVAQSTKIYDRTGEHILYEIHGDEQRTLVKIDDIPNNLKNAVVAMEDHSFYEHKGFSIPGIARTAVTNVISGKRGGASTLTQQLVKNAILTSEQTYTRKIKELILAYKIEKKYSKDEILQMYLNEIPFGGASYGVEAASRLYFDKSVKDITLEESAVLAAIIQSPTRYSPFGSNKDILMGRQQHALNLMAKQGYITQEEAEEAKVKEVIFVKSKANITAPHFVMYVKEQLAERYDEKLIEQGGLKIITTLDLYKQNIAEEVIQEQGDKNAKNYEASNASLVSIDPKTGQILVMVGSRDYFNDEIDGQVNIATRLRQPGSSLKPLVYAATFVKGFTPNSILYDVNTNFSASGKPYEPKNYDLKEHGPVTIRKALAGSLNTPAVKAIYLAGVDSVIDIAKKLGYTSLEDKDRFGLSLVLGGAEVQLLKHTNAYGAFAREGKIQNITSILKVEDKDGKILEEWEEEEAKEVLEPKVARMINDILSDNEARSYAFGMNNWLTLGERPVAAKTGTTNDYRDAWTIGYTPSLVTGVWVGNNDNSPMKRGAAGGVVAAPIWNSYMNKVLGDTPTEYFKTLEEIKTGKAILDGEIGVEKIVRIDKVSGLLATEHTPEELIEEKIFKTHHSVLYYIDKNDVLGDTPEDPTQDPQFDLWESRIIEWVKKEQENATSTSVISTSTPPTEFDNLHNPENKPNVAINEPSNNQTITDGLLTTDVRATAKRGIDKVKYYINNNLLIEKKGPYVFNLDKYDIGFLNNGYHNLKIQVCDDVSNCSETSIEFNLMLENNENNQEFDISWNTPESGLAVNKIDFPLSLGFNIKNNKQISKVELIINGNDSENVLYTIQPVLSDGINYDWNNIPNSGTYRLRAKAYTWNGKTKETNNIVLTVNNKEEGGEDEEETE